MAAVRAKIGAVECTRVALALVLTALGVGIAIAQSLPAQGYMLFGGNGPPLNELLPGFATFLVIAGGVLAVCGVASIFLNWALGPALAICAALAVVVALVTADSSVSIGTSRQTYSVLNLDGAAPIAAVLGAMAALLSAVALLIVRYRPRALMPVLREPSATDR